MFMPKIKKINMVKVRTNCYHVLVKLKIKLILKYFSIVIIKMEISTINMLGLNILKTVRLKS